MIARLHQPSVIQLACQKPRVKSVSNVVRQFVAFRLSIRARSCSMGSRVRLIQCACARCTGGNNFAILRLPRDAGRFRAGVAQW